jgi:inorganic pyrophosphatase
MAKKGNAPADPTKLLSFDSDDKELVQVIIETPKRSRNKYAYDVDQKVFELKKVLPAGMDFPYDFGFIPSTRADDGDPLDVLLLMDEPAFPGCLVRARLIGAVEGEQTEKGKTERNDRLIAVAETCHLFNDVKMLRDLPPTLVEELEQFFVNYHKLDDVKFRVLGQVGPATARKLLKRARKAA